MEYIFFDIECANSYAGKAKICSFGYVVTDKFFNIKKRKDIIVNPESTFDKLALLRMGTELPYPQERYLAAGNFRKAYDEIKNLLTRKDVIIVGHGTHNDAEFIL